MTAAQPRGLKKNTLKSKRADEDPDRQRMAEREQAETDAGQRRARRRPRRRHIAPATARNEEIESLG